MRLPLPLPLLVALAGCAGPLPEPRPGMAWVELHAQPSDVFMADELDGERTDDGRFFQVTPGAHVLSTRYDFEIAGGSFGLFDDRQYLRCTLVFRHDDFQAGQRYRLEARSLGFHPQGWLYDAERQVLARAEVERCGP